MQWFCRLSPPLPPTPPTPPHTSYARADLFTVNEAVLGTSLVIASAGAGPLGPLVVLCTLAACFGMLLTLQRCCTCPCLRLRPPRVTRVPVALHVALAALLWAALVAHVGGHIWAMMTCVFVCVDTVRAVRVRLVCGALWLSCITCKVACRWLRASVVSCEMLAWWPVWRWRPQSHCSCCRRSQSSRSSSMEAAAEKQQQGSGSREAAAGKQRRRQLQQQQQQQ
jgi:hypothetical protein